MANASNTSGTPRGSGKLMSNGILTQREWIKLLVFFALYRAFFSFTIRTAESPDEWWQSSEVAYHCVYGKGNLSWEWHEAIRSVMFPSLYAVPFYLLKVTGLDTAFSLWAAQRVVQAAIMTATDMCTITLAQRLDAALLRDSSSQAVFKKAQARWGMDKRTDSGASVTRTVVVLACFQWYLTYAGVRCYSNTAESLLVMVATLQTGYVSFLLWAAAACVVRITAFLTLLSFLIVHIQMQIQQRGVLRGLRYMFLWTIVIGACTVATMMAVDFLFYKRWVFTPLRFLWYNIVLSVSQNYGTHPWYWYFVVALPFILGPHVLLLFLLPVVLRRTHAGKEVVAIVRHSVMWIVWTLLCLSPVAHKETRFISVTLPPCMVLVSFVLAKFPRGPTTRSRPRRQFLTKDTLWMLHYVFIALNVVTLIYAGYVHRQGSVNAMAFLRHYPQSFERLDIMMPCYTSPGYSHVHGKVKHLGLIDCPIKLDTLTNKILPTEDTLYRQQPALYVWWRYTRNPEAFALRGTEKEQATWWETARDLMPADDPAPLPDGIILFAGVAEELSELFLRPNGYQRICRLFHTIYVAESYEEKYVEVWSRISRRS